jgi:hypothetical protein
MVTFSNDADILKYEPVLFGELHLSNQVVAAGAGGVLSGTTFTAADADFVDAGIFEGQVVYLRSADGTLDGTYEIVSVDSATQLSVSVVRADVEDSVVAPQGATDVFYRICTYKPQAVEIGWQLTKYFGIRPGNPESDIDVDNILNKSVLRTASVFAVISSVYAMLASGCPNETFWEKSLYYKKLFERHRQSCLLSIDTDCDGTADVTRVGSSFRLVRD